MPKRTKASGGCVGSIVEERETRGGGGHTRERKRRDVGKSYPGTWYDRNTNETVGQPGHVEENHRGGQRGQGTGRTGRQERGTGAAHCRGNQIKRGRKCKP